MHTTQLSITQLSITQLPITQLLVPQVASPSGVAYYTGPSFAYPNFVSANPNEQTQCSIGSLIAGCCTLLSPEGAPELCAPELCAPKLCELCAPELCAPELCAPKLCAHTSCWSVHIRVAGVCMSCC